MPPAPSDLTCPDCGTAYRRNAGHCRGGRYDGCCKSFGTNSGFDAHRAGAYSDRRCQTTAEMMEAGWRVTASGLWRSPADERAAEKFRQNAPSRGEGSPREPANPQVGTQVPPNDSKASTGRYAGAP